MQRRPDLAPRVLDLADGPRAPRGLPVPSHHDAPEIVVTLPGSISNPDPVYEVVRIDPAISSGTPCVSRVPVYMVVDMVWEHGVEETRRSYDLSRGAILNACWYAAVINVVHVWRDRGPLGLGVRRSPWRKRWWSWAEEAHEALWRRQYDAVPDPPGRDTGTAS